MKLQQPKRDSRILIKSGLIATLTVVFVIATLRFKSQRNITVQKFIKAVTNSFGPLDGYFAGYDDQMCVEFSQTGKKFAPARMSTFASAAYRSMEGELDDHPNAQTGRINTVMNDGTASPCKRFVVENVKGQKTIHFFNDKNEECKGFQLREIPFSQCTMDAPVTGSCVVDVVADRDPGLVMREDVDATVIGDWKLPMGGVTITKGDGKDGEYDLAMKGATSYVFKHAKIYGLYEDKDGVYHGIIRLWTRVSSKVDFYVQLAADGGIAIKNCDGSDSGLSPIKVMSGFDEEDKTDL